MLTNSEHVKQKRVLEKQEQPEASGRCAARTTEAPLSTRKRYTVWSDALPAFLERVESREPVPKWNLGDNYQDIQIEKGEMVFLGGPPGAGKTVMLLDWLVEILLHDDSTKVLIDQVEMSPEKLIRRLVARFARVNAYKMRDAILSDDELLRIKCDGIPKLEQFSSRIANFDPPHVIEDVIENALDFGASVVCIDYLQRVKTRRRSSSDTRSNIDSVLSTCRDAAMTYGLTIFVASSLARTPSKQGADAYCIDNLSMASFKDSGDIEYSADSAYLLGRSGPKRRLLKCVKTRDDEDGWTVSYDFNGAMYELSRVEGSSTKGCSFEASTSLAVDTQFDGVNW